MIDKIEAEMQEYGKRYLSEARRDALKDCLKWAKEDKKKELEFWKPYVEWLDVNETDSEKSQLIKVELIKKGYDKIEEIIEEIEK